MRLFVGIYVFSAVATLFLFVFPALSIVVLIFTLGFGVVLLFVPTVLIYMTAVTPGLIISKADRGFDAGIALVIIAFLLVFAGPHYSERWLAYREAKPILDEDRAGRISLPPRRLEILSPLKRYGGPDDPLLDAPCDQYCQILLLNGEVDALRITPILEAKDSPRRRGGQAARFVAARSSIVYSYEKRGSCSRAFATVEIILPATRQRAARGECIVATVGGAWQRSVSVLITKAPDWSSPAKPLKSNRSLTRFEIFEAGGSLEAPLARITEMKAQVPTFPFLYGPASSSGLEIRLGILKTEAILKSADLETVLRGTLGFKLLAPVSPPSVPAVESVERLLDAPGTAPFGPELMVTINGYVDSLRDTKQLGLADIQLLERLVADARVADVSRIYFLLRQFPAAATGMIAPILDRLQHPAPESVGHNQNHLAWILVRAPLDSLKPHAERILATAKLSDQWHYAPLLQIVGRFGIDPTGLLQMRLAKQGASRSSAITGVCAADEPWRGQLLPAVEAIVEQYQGQPDRGNSELAVGIFALGEQNAVAGRVLASMTEADRRRILAEVAAMRRRFPDGRCGTA